MKPSVLDLHVHLEGEQSVTYGPNMENAMESIERFSRTMLTEYFKNNADTGETLKYEDYPKKYRWDKKERIWCEKQRQGGFPEQIGSMFRIHPSSGEKFYLRLLLKHVGGATSHDNLKVVGNMRHETFFEACVARRLVRDDSQWRECLEEASELRLPEGIRLLFCNIIINCPV